MKSVYPEVISLRYANIPKTTIEGQCSGIQLLIDMSLSDSPADIASSSKPAAATQSTSKAVNDSSNSSGKRGWCVPKGAPSSTQAVFKAGSTAVAGRGSSAAESVSKAGCSHGAGVRSDGVQPAQSPSEPLRMMAVKAEFERRLEKQVSVINMMALTPRAATMLTKLAQ